MSKYIFSICLVFCFSLANAQETDSIVAPKGVFKAAKFDTRQAGTESAKAKNITIKDTASGVNNRYGLRAGIDLYKLGRTVFDKNYTGTEIAADLRLTKKFYLAGEFGFEDKDTKENSLDFNTNGSYYKLGVDYNSYENWAGMENMIIFGLRYGLSTFSQTLNSYDVYNRNHYFGEEATIVSGQKYSGLSAHWLELVVGVKAQVVKNVYLGFSLRLNHMVTENTPENFENLYIPGFNRTYNGDFGVGFNYTASYFIPIFKK